MIPRSFAISGVTYIKDAQKNIPTKCYPKQKLYLIRNPENIHDANATKVCFMDKGELVQLGWIPKELAVEVAPFLDKGGKLDAVVSYLQGGGDPGYNWGLTLEITSVIRPEMSVQKNQTNQTLTTSTTKSLTVDEVCKLLTD